MVHQQRLFFACSVAVGAGLAACGEDPAGPPREVELLSGGPGAHQAAPPSALATLPYGGDEIRLWPYTGAGFDGAPVDPINLVLLGDAGPVQIRDALFALDGDRTAAGFPPVAPFDGTWTEAIGDVQTGYAEPGGWNASVIQLQLGGYDPIRVHLRLFRVGTQETGVTLGAAHFEALIPGTTEHQVLSWELAEQVVAADLIRTGLVTQAVPTGPLNAAPSFRDIPAQIYNGLPGDLKFLIGGPPGQVTDPVPLPSDGQGTMLTLTGTAPRTREQVEQILSIPFDQVIPRPFCSEGPLDYVYVQGTVDLRRQGTADATGRYSYQSFYDGRLWITPVDVTVNPPAPVGAPFEAIVKGHQTGHLASQDFRVMTLDRRLAADEVGTEMLRTLLRVSSRGGNAYQYQERCSD